MLLLLSGLGFAMGAALEKALGAADPRGYPLGVV